MAVAGAGVEGGEGGVVHEEGERWVVVVLRFVCCLVKGWGWYVAKDEVVLVPEVVAFDFVVAGVAVVQRRIVGELHVYSRSSWVGVSG